MITFFSSFFYFCFFCLSLYVQNFNLRQHGMLFEDFLFCWGTEWSRLEWLCDSCFFVWLNFRLVL